jgi:predicted 2-oxoglutarate/Fe(II)-dependent dioxygenase YbiX
MTVAARISIGEPAPWFLAQEGHDPGRQVAFDELAGRHIVMLCFMTPAHQNVLDALSLLRARTDLFNANRALLVTFADDAAASFRGHLSPQHASEKFLWDARGSSLQRYLAPKSADQGEEPIALAYIMSPSLQILEIIECRRPVPFVEKIVSRLERFLAQPLADVRPPVLEVANVFDRAFCHRLVELYDQSGGRQIGAVEQDGQIVEKFNPLFRKRLDYYIADGAALEAAREMLGRRLLPMVYRAFQFEATRIERYLVGCYDAATGGYFRPHRDNTAPIVAHRRFAITINLNDGYQGGDLRFPEFGRCLYRPPPGGAIVFSCSLLHEVTPVIRGRRYAFISFLYDEASQRLRDQNNKSAMAG